jgi:ligand-binding sensor domain-containing protein/signal transduction histidine kinase/DNA-binding response OmpR family regulator
LLTSVEAARLAMKILRTQTVLVVLLLIAFAGSTQQIRFRNYSVSDGLPSSTVRAILQDDQGFLWFGTKNGLSRFDGYQFRNFQFAKKLPGSLGNNFIHCIYRFDSTHLWVGTENGVYVLDLERERFELLPPTAGKTVFGIVRDQQGYFWISTRLNGLLRFDPVSGKYIHFIKNNTHTSVSSDNISKMTVDHEGKIWIGTYGNGVDVYDPVTKRFTNYHSGNSGLSNDHVNTLYKGLDGAIWVGTMNGGLCRWQKETSSFRVYKKGGPKSIRDNIVRAIWQNTPGKLYVGTEKGLNILDIPTGEFVAYTNQGNDPLSISDNAVYSIFTDKGGTTWLGTFFGGVNYFNEKASVFELYYPTGDPNNVVGKAVSCFLEDQPGKFWIGTEDGGLHYFDAAARSFKRYPFLPHHQSLSYHNIHCLLKDSKGKIWIGIFAGGLNIYDPRTGSVSQIGMQPSDPHSLNSNNIFSLYEDKDGTVWVGTDRGLNTVDVHTGKITRIINEATDNTIVYDIYEDNTKTMWIATYNNGLASFNKRTGEWKSIHQGNQPNSLSSSKLTCLHDDYDGNLWIGTDGGGLNRYNYRTKEIKVYDEQSGIGANVIYGIQEDDNGTIWLTTNNGIYSFDPQHKRVRHFTPQDNLQSRQFNYGAFYKASDGKLLAGGIKGFNVFSPEKAGLTPSVSSISFTNFQLFNKNISPDEKESPLSRQINYTKELELRHDQSVISFEFAALSFTAPEKVRYAYKMEGFDQAWNFVGEQRKATYTNMAPGTYTFRVKATTDKGNWDVPEKTITLIIYPPFYRTTLAYLVYVLLLLLLMYAAFKYSSAYVKKRNQIKLERLKNKEEQEFYARKIEFFTVMAHEIRTPLSLIIAPLERLLSTQKRENQEKEQLMVMEENAERLMHLVNQLLDFRRIESDAYEIRKEEVEMVSLVQSIYSRFSSLPYQKGLEFTLSTKVSGLYLQADPEVINKILSNLLINAFKFARKKISLHIQETKYEAGGHNVSISVEDDGIGIPAGDIKNIFRKFFTTSRGSHQYHNLGSSGIGLTLASSLAERHGGRLLVESREGIKTTFTLEIPYVKNEQPAVEAVVATEIEEASETLDNRKTILLVEDDPELKSFIGKSLKSEGYCVLSAGNGHEALECMTSANVDLIISDVMMPEMNGLDLCRRIKNNINFSHIPFVLLTAKSNKETEIEGIEIGADAYIQKPFKWKHIVALIRNLLESRERLKQKFSEQPQLDATVLTTNSRDKQFIEDIVRVIEERLTDSQFSVEELSREMAMSRSSLHKKLKSLSGYGPNELIKLVRLKHAARLLLQGAHSITEVAYISGFGSASYFIRCFQAQFKLTPKEFAEKHVKKDLEQINQILNKNDFTD